MILLEKAAGEAPPSAKKGKKRAGGAAGGAASGAFKDFKIDNAKSSRSTCRGCEEKIVKDELRISKKDYESESARRYGGQDRWHHVECFLKLRNELGFFESGNMIPGFELLSKDDQRLVTKSLTKIKEGDASEIKKPKHEPEDLEEENQLKEQNQLIFSMRDKLNGLPKQALASLLIKNNQQVPEGIPSVSIASIHC